VELSAAHAAASEASLRKQQEAGESQAAMLAAQQAAVTEQQRQLDDLSRDLGREKDQLEQLAAQLEVRWQPDGFGRFYIAPE